MAQTKIVAAFDYEQLDAETRIVVQQRTRELRDERLVLEGLMHQTIQSAWRIGGLLLDVQTKLEHGQFLNWLEAEFPGWSRSSAYRFIDVARRIKFPTVGNLDMSLKALYLLAAPQTPEEARQEAIDRSLLGERITHAKAETIVSTARAVASRNLHPGQRVYHQGSAYDLVFILDGHATLKAPVNGLRKYNVPLAEIETEAEHRASGIARQKPAQVGGASWPVEPHERRELRVDPTPGADQPTTFDPTLNALRRAYDYLGNGGEGWHRYAFGNYQNRDLLAGLVADGLIEADAYQQHSERLRITRAGCERVGAPAPDWLGAVAPKTDNGFAPFKFEIGQTVQTANGESFVVAKRNHNGHGVAFYRFEGESVLTKAHPESDLQADEHGLYASSPACRSYVWNTILDRLGQVMGYETDAFILVRDPSEPEKTLPDPYERWLKADIRPAADAEIQAVLPEWRPAEPGETSSAPAAPPAEPLSVQDGQSKSSLLKQQFKEAGLDCFRVVAHKDDLAGTFSAGVFTEEVGDAAWADAYAAGEAIRALGYRVLNAGIDSGPGYKVMSFNGQPAIFVHFALPPSVELADESAPAPALVSETPPDAVVSGAVDDPTNDDLDASNDEWGTPPEWIERARSFMGVIDTDPASNSAAQRIVKANFWFDKAENGLKRDWRGRAWLNPPYSYPLIERFARKAISEYESGNIEEALILTNNRTDATWFQELLTRATSCFLKDRINFVHAYKDSSGNRQGQVLFYLGNRQSAFVEEFGGYGVVVQPVVLFQGVER